MILAEGLGRRFGDYVAVHDVNVDIPRGEVFGVLGPNGAGKTTTLRLLTGLVAPTSGKAEVAGISVVRDPEGVRAKVGILTETPGLYARLDAIENLRFYADVHGVKNAMPKIQGYLERFGLWARRHEPVGAFSKGMRQKLAIARAVLHDPEVVFLDEPTSALDPESSRIVRDLVEELRAAGRTIVLCTHNLDEAERLCDRIGVLKRTLLHVDTPKALRRKLYGHLVEIDTLGAIPEPVLAALQALEGVREVRPALHTEGCIASIADPRTDTPRLVALLVDKGVPILRVAEQARSLEDVYLDLLREGGAP
ncbi:MAG: ABC transporter ATP-binding protein [Sandaracinaceae bacterium]|nr:ABC transporter ATP-binding protein [Sandaracinaceae bacterium]